MIPVTSVESKECPVFAEVRIGPKLLQYRAVETDPKPPAESAEPPAPPRLPQRAAIYIAPDGTVHFGALFKDLVPVAAALGRLTGER